MNVAARLCDHCKTAAAGETLLVSADLLRTTAVPPVLCVGTPAYIALSGRQVPVETYAAHHNASGNQRGVVMANFDGNTLRELRDLQEIAIRTKRHPDSAVVIWVVVADDDVFVRSVHGSKGRW